MALISCPECRQGVSDQAMSCPKCGYPLIKPEYRTHEVYTSGFRDIGRNELNDLLKNGWRVIDEENNDDDQNYRTTYKLQRP